jgi:hypothetical protein
LKNWREVEEKKRKDWRKRINRRNLKKRKQR